MTWVYPRVCGGTGGRQANSTLPGGLSPRVRGNQGWAEFIRRWLGSIPACAGEPSISHRLRVSSRVYPRVCGGTTEDQVNPVTGPGLSPRVRGNPTSEDYESIAVWSIPACAGEPLRC